MRLTNTAHLKNLPLLLFLALLIGQTHVFGQISGTVFFDGNNDGAQSATELGFEFVTVTATDVAGNSFSAVTDANGDYSIAGPVAGTNYQIEFAYPSGYNDGAAGTGSGTSIQYADGAATDIDLGIYVPNQCDPDDEVRVVMGTGLDNDASDHTVRSWLYLNDRVPETSGANGSITTHDTDVMTSDSGVPNGVDVQTSTQYVFWSTISASLTSIFPADPGGQGVIRVGDYTGATQAFQSQKILLDVDNYASTSATAPIIDSEYGEYGLGGIALSDDGNFLYAVNLGRRNIIRFDISTLDFATIPVGGYTGLPFIEIPITTASCTNGTFRPHALDFYGGSLYVGGVCDAETSTATDASGNYTDLRLQFHRMDPATNAFTLVLDHAPDYTVGGLRSIDWPQVQWSATYLGGDNTGDPGEVQPVLHDIAFTDDGDMMIGVVNRQVFVDGESDRETGYMLRTDRQADGSFVVESGGVSGNKTTTGRTTANGDGGAQPGKFTGDHDGDGNLCTGNDITNDEDIGGPGCDWFFEVGRTTSHPYLFTGGIMVLPGTGEVVAGFGDPGSPSSQAGARYMDYCSGLTTHHTSLIGAKATVLAGSEAVCPEPTVEIGNYVWLDNNNDGIQDAGDTPLAGVTVELIDVATGNVIATAVTDANGNYIFSSDGNQTSTSSHIYGLNLTAGGNYIVSIPNAQGGSQQSALTGYFPTIANTSGTTNDETDRTDSDGLLNGDSLEVAVTIGAAGQNNHTFDFGFSTTPACTPPAAPVLSVTDNDCATGTAGSFNVDTACSTGSSIEYSTDGGTNWSSTPPPYDPAFAVSITARCIDDADPNCVSASSNEVTSNPIICPNSNPCENPICNPVPTADVCADGSGTLTLSCDDATLTNIIWYDGSGTQVGTGCDFIIDNTMIGDGTAGQSECFYFQAEDSNSCAGASCCPVIVNVVDCCLPDQCITAPFSITRN